METCAVRYVELPATDIFGMVGRCGGGYNTIWEDWSTSGRIARENIMQEFEQGINEICGHYDKLEQSMLEEGCRNPIVVTGGLPRKRDHKLLPPELRDVDPATLLILEGTTGGSRLHIAQKHNMIIPCIVNDWHDRFPNAPLIEKPDDARRYYKDAPKRLLADPRSNFMEAWDQQKVGYHLGTEFTEDKVVRERAPMWVRVMNKYGYRVERLPEFVHEILAEQGIDQSNV